VIWLRLYTDDPAPILFQFGCWDATQDRVSSVLVDDEGCSRDGSEMVK
jgi:hypothetical protein